MIRNCQLNAGDHGTSDVAKIYASSRSKKRIAFMFVKVAERRGERRPPQMGMDCVVFEGSVSLLSVESAVPWPVPKNASASERARLDGEYCTDGRLRKKETLQMKGTTLGHTCAGFFLLVSLIY